MPGQATRPSTGLAPGPDTLFGGSGAVSILGGANDTFVAGSGSATVDAPLGNNVFVFNDGKAGGSALIQGFTSGMDTIDLLGYGKNEVTQALKHQQCCGRQHHHHAVRPHHDYLRRRVQSVGGRLQHRLRWQAAATATAWRSPRAGRPRPRRIADDDLSHIRDLPDRAFGSLICWRDDGQRVRSDGGQAP